MKRLALLLFLLLLALPARAATLRMVYAEGFAPFSWTEDGRVTGILPDIMDEAARRMGVSVTHQTAAGDQVPAKVKSMGADAFLSTPSKDYASFTKQSAEPVLTSSVGLFVSLSSEPLVQKLRMLKDPDELKGLQLCASQYDAWSRQKLGSMDLTLHPTLAQAITAMARGDCQVMAQVPEVVEFHTARLGLTGKVLRVPGVFLDEVGFHLLVNKYGAAAALLPAFERALAAMRADGTLVAILTRPR